MNKRALVTGASGFAGKTLCARLEAQGWEVHGCGYPPCDEVAPCDVSDREQVRNTLDAVGGLTHVFHLAALTFVPDGNRDPVKAMRVNLEGTVNLATALRDGGAQARLIFVGSAEAYGAPKFLPMTEAHPLEPVNPYAISKAAADHYCAFLSRSSKMEIVRLRPFNHSGPGQSDQFVLSSFARQIAAIEAGAAPPRIHVGNLEAKRDFMHVGDVVRAYELAALEAEPGEAYNLCSGAAQSIQDALDALLAMGGVDIEIVKDPQRMRPADAPEIVGSHGKFTAATGWQPEIPFETLLRELLEYWRAEIRNESSRAVE